MEIPHIRVKTAQPETYVYVPVATKKTLGTVKVNDDFLEVDTETGNLSAADNIKKYVTNELAKVEKELKEFQDADEVIESIKEADVAIKEVQKDIEEVQKDIEDAEKMINNIIKSNGNVKPAEGENSAIIGDNDNNVSGKNSLAVGHENTVQQHNGAAIGGGCQAGISLEEWNNIHGSGGVDSYGLTYDKSYSFAFATNEGTQAKGRASSAFGKNTVAEFERQFVIGKFNDNKNFNLFEIGNGEAVATGEFDEEGKPTFTFIRKNAFEVDKYNNATIFGRAEIKKGANIYGPVKMGGARTEKSYFGGTWYQLDEDGNVTKDAILDLPDTTIFGNIAVSGRLIGVSYLYGGNWWTEDANAVFNVGIGTAWNKRQSAFRVLKDGRAKLYAKPIESDDVVRKEELDKTLSGLNIHNIQMPIWTNKTSFQNGAAPITVLSFTIYTSGKYDFIRSLSELYNIGMSTLTPYDPISCRHEYHNNYGEEGSLLFDANDDSVNLSFVANGNPESILLLVDGKQQNFSYHIEIIDEILRIK